MENEKKYREILESIESKREKKVFEMAYSKTKNLNETLVYMFNKFNKVEYALLIDDDNIKLMLFNESGDSTIACSIKDDYIKASIIDSDKKYDSYTLCEIISSIEDDSIKISCLHKRKEQLHDDYELSITDVICSIKDETLKLNEMYYYCDDEFKKCGARFEFGGFIEDGAPTIIASLNSDEEKIKIMNELQNIYNNSLHIERIIASLQRDENKILILNENIDKISNPEIIICTVSTDESKIELMEKHKDRIYRFDIIINVLSADELKFEQYELYKESMNAYLRVEVIDNIKDVKLKEKMANETMEELGIYHGLDVLRIGKGKEIKIGKGDFIEIDEEKMIVPSRLVLPEGDSYTLEYFNSEISSKNLSRLFSLSSEEIIDFFTFANVLGCFSSEKILNEDNAELEATIGQKASSLLAQLIKTENLAIRKISWLF